MNHTRILRATNGLLMLIGYQLHHFDVKSHRFRLSLWTVGHFIILSAFYAIAFAHHFERSAVLHLLQDVSPFLRLLVRVQLVLGLQIYLYGIHEMRLVTRATNEFAETLPGVFARKFSRQEAYTYFLDYSTLAIGFCITLYVAYEMDFELPPLDNILIFCGMFIPHFVLGGSLKLYNVGAWLIRDQLLEFQGDFQHIIPNQVEDHNNKALVLLENGELTDTPKLAAIRDLSAPLRGLYKKLEKLVKTAEIFNGALVRQLGLLVILNCNCLLGGTYSRVYYENTWHLVFMESTKKVFQATNWGIFILISWDYLTLLLTQSLFLKVKNTFGLCIRLGKKQRDTLTESSRYILDDMDELLKEGFKPKFLNILDLNLRSFVVFHILFGIVTAVIVIYHHLSDQIFALSERFDSLDETDD